MDSFLLFFTASIVRWENLFFNDCYKDIIMNSLKNLVEKQRIYLYGFVIMPNHIHLIWQTVDEGLISDVQRDFLKFTAQSIKFDLIINDLIYLQNSTRMVLIDYINFGKGDLLLLGYSKDGWLNRS
jgi:hypothetical protein